MDKILMSDIFSIVLLYSMHFKIKLIEICIWEGITCFVYLLKFLVFQ